MSREFNNADGSRDRNVTEHEDIFRLKGKKDCAARAARLVLHYLPHGNKIDKMKVFTAMSVRVAKSLFIVKG